MDQEKAVNRREYNKQWRKSNPEKLKEQRKMSYFMHHVRAKRKQEEEAKK